MKSPKLLRADARERLVQLGAAALRDEELIALLLRTGSASQDVSAAARALLASGGLAALAGRGPEEIARERGVGPAKAASLTAAIEIGRRLAARPIPRGQRIRHPSDLHHHFHARLRDAVQEEFHVVLLDGRHRFLRSVLNSRGTLTASLVHPREVFRPALAAAAGAVALVHNHPCGDPTPSDEDRQLTRRLVEAGTLLGIPVLDHVIVAADGFSSLRERGEL